MSGKVDGKIRIGDKEYEGGLVSLGCFLLFVLLLIVLWAGLYVLVSMTWKALPL